MDFSLTYYGVRPLKRVMQREILNPLSKEMLGGRINKEDVIGATLNDQQQIEFLNLNELEIDR